MMFSFFHKNEPTPALYDDVYFTVMEWLSAEFSNIPVKTVDDPSKQSNPLLNFITLDPHSYVIPQGIEHLRNLLTYHGPDSSVMMRLKGLTTDLYLRHGMKPIDALRKRTYQVMIRMYGLGRLDLEAIDVTNTLWLYPFLRRSFDSFRREVGKQVRQANPKPEETEK